MEQAARTQHAMLCTNENSPSEAAHGRPQQSKHFARLHGPRGRAWGCLRFAKQKESTANMQHGGASGNVVPIDGDAMRRHETDSCMACMVMGAHLYHTL
jgi:hypothetical protein